MVGTPEPGKGFFYVITKMKLLDTKDLQKQLDQITVNEESKLLEVKPNYKITLYSSQKSRLDTSIVVGSDDEGEVLICLEQVYNKKDFNIISLDKESALLLSFMLQREIYKI